MATRGLLDDISGIFEDPLFQFGVGVLAGNNSRNPGPAILLGSKMAQDAAEKQRKRKEWEAITQAGKKQIPTFEWQSKDRYYAGDAADYAANKGGLHDTPEAALQAYGIDPSKAVTQGIGNNRVDIDVREIGPDGKPSIAPIQHFRNTAPGNPMGFQQDGLNVPPVQKVAMNLMVPGVPQETFDPRAALQAAMQTGDMDIASKAAPLFSSYAKAEQDQLENKALEEVQTALQQTGGDPEKAVQALLQAGNYKGATALINAVKKTGGDTAPVQNWAHRQAMIKAGATAEEIAQFDAYVRANQIGNLGNIMVPFSGVTGQPIPGLPVAPNAMPGQPRTGYRVGLKPGELPSVQGEQAGAQARAKAEVERGTEQTKQGDKAAGMLPMIDEAKSILESGKVTGSGVGAKVDIAKGLVGVSDETTQNNARLKALSGWLTGSVPRFEGPQSDADRQYYLDMAGRVGDSSIPVKDRIAALETVRYMQENKMRPSGAKFSPSKPDGAAPIQGEGFKMLPNAKEWENKNPGKIIKDTKTGKRYKAVSGKWQEVK